MQKNYYAIIPANVRYDKDLSPNAKLLYGEITALCNEKGYCWAGNSYFADLYGKDKSTIARWIKQLEDKGYITREVIYKEGTLEIENRYMRICNGGIGKNATTPIGKNERDNITSFNTTFNNSTTTAAQENPIVYFEKMLCRISPRQSDSLYKWVDDFGGQVEIIIEAIDIADNRNKRTFGFVEFLLREWADNKLDSLDRVRAYEQEKFNKQKQTSTGRGGDVGKVKAAEQFARENGIPF
jgi:DnaD/phage-associated family protein